MSNRKFEIGDRVIVTEAAQWSSWHGSKGVVIDKGEGDDPKYEVEHFTGLGGKWYYSADELEEISDHSPEWDALIGIAIENFEERILECGPNAEMDLRHEARTTFEKITMDDLIDLPEFMGGTSVAELLKEFIRDVDVRWGEMFEERLPELRRQWEGD